MELTRARWGTMPPQSGAHRAGRKRPRHRPAGHHRAGERPAGCLHQPHLERRRRDARRRTAHLRSRVAQAPGQVEVEVIDTGIGMDEATRTPLPGTFFTTKGERGTGLGLAMVYGMIERHGGDLQVESGRAGHYDPADFPHGVPPREAHRHTPSRSGRRCQHGFSSSTTTRSS